MKKLVSFAAALCVLLTACGALAADENPFQEGIDYTIPYQENGARPSMLNFGCAVLKDGKTFYDVKTTGVHVISAQKLADSLGETSYYCYAKWQNKEAFSTYRIEAMMVMTDPQGNHYAEHAAAGQVNGNAGDVYSWFFDVTGLLMRCRDGHGGALPAGEYRFTLYFNDQFFRETAVTVK